MTPILRYVGKPPQSGVGPPAVSADGRIAIFQRENQFVVRDIESGSERVFDNKWFFVMDISADGQWVVGAGRISPTELLPIARMNLLTGEIQAVSTSAEGTLRDGRGGGVSVSGNGRYVIFQSEARDLVPGSGGPGFAEVYLKDMLTGAIKKLSDSDGTTYAKPYARPDISDDGGTVSFIANQHGIVAYPDFLQLMRLEGGQDITVVSGWQDFARTGAAMSGDGRYIVYTTDTQLSGDTNTVSDVYYVDTVAKTRMLASVGANGEQSNAPSGAPHISADGRYVIFTNAGGGLVPGAGPGGGFAVYRKDMQTGALDKITAGNGMEQEISQAVASIDGSRVSFTLRDGIWQARLDGDNGGAADELFIATPGAQAMHGGGGLDTALYHGARAQYAISKSGGTVTVADSVAGRDGTDTMVAIERLKFWNVSVALDVDGHGGQAYRLYEAAFNRAPDQAGAGFWIKALDGGVSLSSVAGEFMRSAEFAAAFGTAPTHAQLVNKFYENVLGRAGDAAGVAYWIGVLDTHPGAARDVLVNFSESPENVLQLAGVIGNGFDFIPYG